MQTNEFYQKFANTPLLDRIRLIKMSENDPLTLLDIYNRVSKLEDKIRPQQIEIKRLIGIAEEYFYKLNNII